MPGIVIQVACRLHCTDYWPRPTLVITVTGANAYCRRRYYRYSRTTFVFTNAFGQCISWSAITISRLFLSLISSYDLVR